MLGLPPAFVLSQDQTLKLKPPKGFLTFEPSHIVIDFDVSMFPERNSDHIKLMKLTTIIIDPQAKARFSRWPIYVGPSVYKRPQTTRIPLHQGYNFKERPLLTPGALEAIGGEAHPSTSPPVSAGYMQIRPTAQQVF